MAKSFMYNTTLGRNIKTVCTSKRNPKGPYVVDTDRPTNLEYRRVGHVEGEAGLGDEFTALRRLLHTLLRQGHVLPPRETVLVVPGTLPVPGQKYIYI